MTDYLAKNNQASPFQHFWALSIQFQFYLTWVALFLVAMLVMGVWRRFTLSRVLPVLISVLVTGSLAYSIYLTDIRQSLAYYHTFTRIWEFGVGGLLACWIGNVALRGKVAWIASWAGLVGLVSTGVLFQVSEAFPGYIAIWPVAAAALLILSGENAGRYSGAHLLQLKPFVWFGGISYAFYLWHWPLLIYYYALTGRAQVPLWDGVFIIVGAALLADVTIRFIERPIRLKPMHLPKTAATLAVLAAAVLVSSLLFQLSTTNSASGDPETLEEEQETNDPNPGAAVKSSEGSLHPKDDYDAPLLPDLAAAKQDRADIYDDGCMVGYEDTDVKVCDYGATENPERTIALVGSSHAAHWLPMLQEAVGDEVKIETYIKANCRFTMEENEEHPDCTAWFDKTRERLTTSAEPDLIFAVGNVPPQHEVYEPGSAGFKRPGNSSMTTTSPCCLSETRRGMRRTCLNVWRSIRKTRWTNAKSPARRSCPGMRSGKRWRCRLTRTRSM